MAKAKPVASAIVLPSAISNPALAANASSRTNWWFDPRLFAIIPARSEVPMGLYSHYDGAHTHPVNRALHLIAIPVGFSSVVVVWFHWIIALLLIPMAFALAWLGHLIEGNQPAFLTNPVHVFVAPVWMVRRIFRRRESKPDVSPPAKAI